MKLTYYCVYSQFNALGVGLTPEDALANAHENFDFTPRSADKRCYKVKFAKDVDILLKAQEQRDLGSFKMTLSKAGNACQIRR